MMSIIADIYKSNP